MQKIDISYIFYYMLGEKKPDMFMFIYWLFVFVTPMNWVHCQRCLVRDLTHDQDLVAGCQVGQPSGKGWGTCRATRQPLVS